MPTNAPPKIPSLLVVILSHRVAGAERMAFQLLEGLSQDFACRIGFLRNDEGDWGGAQWAGEPIGRRELLFGHFDLIHTHLFLPGMLIRLRRTWDKSFRWVHTVHYSSHSASWIRGLKAWLDQGFIFPRADRLVAVSETVLQALSDFPNCILIENGVDLTPFENGRRVQGTGPGGAPVLGTVAMLRREKGVRDLLKTMQHLRENNPGILLKVAGDGPLLEGLQGAVRELGLQGNVRLEGYVTDLDSFYSSLDLYVQPSIEEGFGLGVVDAMRFGLPIVASSVGFLPTLLGNGEFGALIARDELFVSRLAEAIEEVLHNRIEYQARTQRGLEYWRTRISLERMTERYRNLFQELLQPNSG